MSAIQHPSSTASKKSFLITKMKPSYVLLFAMIATLLFHELMTSPVRVFYRTSGSYSKENPQKKEKIPNARDGFMPEYFEQVAIEGCPHGVDTGRMGCKNKPIKFIKLKQKGNTV